MNNYVNPTNLWHVVANTTGYTSADRTHIKDTLQELAGEEAHKATQVDVVTQGTKEALELPSGIVLSKDTGISVVDAMFDRPEAAKAFKAAAERTLDGVGNTSPVLAYYEPAQVTRAPWPNHGH